MTETAKLRLASELFFDLSNDMLCIAGTDGFFKEVNATWTATLGYSRAELLERQFVDFVHPDDKARTIEESSALGSEDHQTVRFENRYRHQDGSYRWISWRAKMRDGLIFGVARDITEKKAAELALEAERNHFRALFANMQEGFVVYNRRGEVVKFNDAALKITGLTAVQVEGSTPRDAPWQLVDEQLKPLNPEDHPSSRTLQTSKPVTDFMAGIRRIDASIVWIRVNSQPIFDLTTHKLDQVLVTFQDVSQINRDSLLKDNATRALKEAEKIAKLGSWVFDVPSQKITWSDQMFQLFPEDKANGAPTYQRHAETVHPDDRELWASTVQKCVETGEPYVFRFRSIFPDGKTIWIEARGHGVFDSTGRVTQLMGTCLDVTESVMLERELRRSQNFLQKTLDHMPGPVYSKDLDGRMLFANSVYYRVVPTGGTPVIGKTDHEILPKDIANAVRANDLEIIRGKKMQHFEEVVPNNGGVDRYYDTFKFPMLDDAGDVFAVTGVSIDITEKRRLERELKEKTQIAHHAARLALIGELAANVGHEINNPLAIADGHIEIVRNELEQSGRMDEMLNHSFEKYAKASSRIASIVQGLRTLSRADDERIEEVDISELMEQLHQLVFEIYKNEGITVRLTPPKKGLTVSGSSGRLQQAIMNLISNARDAVMSAPKKVIELDVRADSGSIAISVRDTGSGIPDHLREKIFRPFYTTKPFGRGTGIGLSISLSIVRECNGTLTYESGSEGTVFQMVLPRSEGRNRTPQAIVPAKDGIGAHLKGKRVLVVDDEEEMRFVIAFMLETVGCIVSAVGDGLKAQEAILSSVFDVVVTDMMMPHMGGQQLLSSLSRLHLPKLPGFVTISGALMTDQQIERDNFDGLKRRHLVKPFPFEELVAAMTQVLK